MELNPPFDMNAGGTTRVTTWLITHFLSEIFEGNVRQRVVADEAISPAVD